MSKLQQVQVVRALRELEAKWPKDYWLFAAAGTLTLMKKKNGQRVVDKITGGMDSALSVAQFKGIECDGGDW